VDGLRTAGPPPFGVAYGDYGRTPSVSGQPDTLRPLYGTTAGIEISEVDMYQIQVTVREKDGGFVVEAVPLVAEGCSVTVRELGRAIGQMIDGLLNAALLEGDEGGSDAGA
jgi:hypothetical protein